MIPSIVLTALIIIEPRAISRPNNNVPLPLVLLLADMTLIHLH